MGKPMQIQIVVPTASFGPRVDGLLADLARELAQDGVPEVSVAVVDNEAVHDVSGLVRNGGDVTSYRLPSPSNGPAINRNRGATWSQAPWLVFLDDDVRVPDGWLLRIARVIGGPDPADLIGGMIGSQAPSNLFSQAAEDFVVRHREYPEGWFLAAAHLVVRRSAFEALGGFDTGFDYGGEDWDLCRRAHSLGLRVDVEPTISVAHANAMSWPELRRKAEQYGRANAFLDADTVAAPTVAPTAAVGETGGSQGGHRIGLGRRIRWAVTEYRALRNQGRSPLRAARSTVLQAAWMRAYLAAYDAALTEARAARVGDS